MVHGRRAFTAALGRRTVAHRHWNRQAQGTLPSRFIVKRADPLRITGNSDMAEVALDVASAPAEGAEERMEDAVEDLAENVEEFTEGVGQLLDGRRTTNILLACILALMVGSALYFAAAFFMPVVLALLLALTLSPVVRWLARRRIPEPLSAAALVFGLTALILGSFAALGTPFLDLIDDFPRLAEQAKERFEQVRAPIETVTEITDQVDEATKTADTQTVVVAQPGIVSQVAGSALSIMATTAIVVILTLFLLASGEHFYEQIVKSYGTLSKRKQALGTVFQIEREISRYLLTITLINAALGATVGIGLYVLGMPNPAVWGVAAALLNFVPYVGSLAGVALVGIVAFVHFPTLGQAVLPPLFYLACTITEGQFVTPTVVGRRLRINTVAVFVAIAFWSFLWNIPGALMAVPILVFMKVLCDNVATLNGIGRFLSAEED